MALSAAGCAKSAIDRAVPGVTTEAELNAALGQPSRVWTPAVRPEARLNEYNDGCTRQIEKGRMVSISCPPGPGESTLQSWRHQWVGHEQRFEPLPGTENSHGQRRFQFASKQAGMAVIYDESVDRVVRVVKHAKP